MDGQQHNDSSGRVDSSGGGMPVVDAKAEAELLVVCAATHFPVGQLTQFERFLWSQAFGRGAVFGLELAKVEIRAMGAA